MSSPAEQRAKAEARQRELAEARRAEQLAWTNELLEHPTPELIQRALRGLGFREPVEYNESRLSVRDLVRLLRGRSSADWSFRDVEPLVLPPARYKRIGEVVELRGELPSVVVSTEVVRGTTLGFEVGLDHREWVVERGGSDVGYVGTPPPEVGSPVYAVIPP
jgi:hypothetical protein